MVKYIKFIILYELVSSVGRNSTIKTILIVKSTSFELLLFLSYIHIVC